MPCATAPELPSPWREFLAAVDGQLPEPVELHCLGGFIGAICYGLARPTNDVDYVEILPWEARYALQKVAGQGSALAKTYRLHFEFVPVASLPESYADRLTELFPGRFRHLRLFAVDPYDLALSKLGRHSAVDREDVAHLARFVPLDPIVLQARYKLELRPIVVGDVKELDYALKTWIQSSFPPSR
ncbi:MAG: DUF6036 family nucleotidyltransferase [Candidatus Dormibacteraeota bacterium]|nr:DUF6036 family nucleotidyltransferase [Candidatus Dormibacteraeota bacterium]